MEIIVPAVILLLAIFAFALGRLRDANLAKRIGNEVRPYRPQASSDDTVALLERLHRLRQQGALTEAEYEAQKAHILGEI